MVTLATGPYFHLEAAEMGEPWMILKPYNKPHLFKKVGSVPWDTVPFLVSMIHFTSYNQEDQIYCLFCALFSSY